MLRLADVAVADVAALLARHGLALELVAAEAPIPTNRWFAGDPGDARQWLLARALLPTAPGGNPDDAQCG